MTIIHIFRHGETEWNVERRAQGSKNSKLTSTGIEQALALKNKIERLDIDIAYSSTSLRAAATLALLLDETAIPSYQDPNLCEMNLGDWEGLTFEDIEKQDPVAHHLFNQMPSKCRATNGESFVDCQQRSMTTVSRIAREHQGSNILIVSHGMFIRTLLVTLQGISLDHLWSAPLGNLSHLTIRFSDQSDAELIAINQLFNLQ